MNLRHITLLALLSCATFTYAQENNVDENEVGIKEERPDYGQGFHAHRYALQKPHFAKKFEKKVLGDRLFFDFGAGLTFPFSGSQNSKSGFVTGISVGDWLTPEHGVRAGIKFGNYTYGNYDISAKGLTLDYLMNISALSTPGKTYTPKRFEVLGVAGLDILHRSFGNASNFGLGVHVGGRAQYSIPQSIFQIYAEPRLYFMDGRGQGSYTSNMYKSGMEVLFGLSVLPYQRVIPTGNQADLDDDGHFLNNTFIYFAGGPQVLLSPLNGTMFNTLGARAQGGIGKWFNRGYGVRLSGYTNFLQEKDDAKNKGFGISADAMIDLTYLNEGYNPHRRFWINGMIGASLALHKHEGIEKLITYGFGAGLQPNFRLREGISFFVEPRIDVLNNKNSVYGATTSSWAVVPSLLAGVNFMQGGDTNAQRQGNFNFTNQTLYDHLFIDGALGAYFAGGSYRTLLSNPTSQAHPKIYAAIGKWFNATSGMRIWGDINKPRGVTRADHLLTVGIDYLWNITNTFHGYDPARKFEFQSSLGFNILNQKQVTGLAYGLNAGVRAQWNATKMAAFFIEPQVRLYKEEAERNNYTFEGIDFVPVGLLGMQLRFNGYSPEAERDDFMSNDYDSFFGVAGGLQVPLRKYNEGSLYGPIARLTYGKQFSPLSTYRIHGLASANKFYNKKHVMAGIGADYMTDLTALAHGYNEDRVFTLSSFVGANANISYQSGDNFYFYPEVYVGAQAALKVSKRLTFFYEPQLRYDFTDQWKHAYKAKELATSQRFSMAHLVGMNMKFDGSKDMRDDYMSRKYDHYFGVAGGLQVPLRKYNEGSLYGPIARLTYGKQFSPVSTYRIHGHASANKFYNKKHAMAGVGADYMVDVTALAHGYNEDRVLTLHGLVGANANVSYQSGGNFYFYPEVYAGAQAALRVSDRFTLFYEPQLRYDFTDQWKFAYKAKELTTSQRFSMAHLLGLNMKFDAFKNLRDEKDSYLFDEKTEFISVAGGLQVPIRRMNIAGYYGPLMRLSYGKQNTAFTLYRFNAAMEYNHFGRTHYAKASLGADYMLDFTAWAYGYDPDRRFNLRPYAGLDLSLSRARQNYYLFPELIVGAQAGIRATKNIEFYYEGQIKYGCSNQIRFAYNTRNYVNTFRRLVMSHMIGMNYRFTPAMDSYKNNAGYERPYKEFVSASAGVNLNSATFFYINPTGNKWGFSSDISYGRWLNGVRGFRIGIDNTQFKAKRWGRQQHWTSIHADFMCDLRTLLTNNTHEKKLITCDGFLGLGVGFSTQPKETTNIAPVINAGVQIGANIGERFNIYLEPAGQLFGKRIWQRSNEHPFELTGKIMLGTKFKF